MRRSSPEPLKPNQWYDNNTYYQILFIEPENTSKPRKYLKTTLVTQTREEFKKYELDLATRDKLQNYPISRESSQAATIASYLPSSGVVFKKEFLNSLFPNDDYSRPVPEFNNFYDVYRTLLHSRKISQLIAKTWYYNLEAKKSSDWNNFVGGKWEQISSDILDALIAREIFMFGSASEADEMKPDNSNIYYELSSSDESVNSARFFILPSSKNWQSISLSLLLSGQVYYKVEGQNGATEYHQVAQPILSTGEIVMKYALDVALDTDKGDIKELDIKSNKASAAYMAVIPYPPIPSEDNLTIDEIKNWADADDVEGDFPFYLQEDGEYLIGVKYHTAPYPYIPLSCT